MRCALIIPSIHFHLNQKPGNAGQYRNRRRSPPGTRDLDVVNIRDRLLRNTSSRPYIDLPNFVDHLTRKPYASTARCKCKITRFNLASRETGIKRFRAWTHRWARCSASGTLGGQMSQKNHQSERVRAAADVPPLIDSCFDVLQCRGRRSDIAIV